MACPFCATGQGGLQRNLSTAEIVEQVRLAARAARDGAMGEPGRLSNVVFMGMGEPLANYKRVLAAVKLITAPAPHGLGHLRAVGDRVDRRAGAGDRAADRGEAAGAAGGVAAHAGRRTARHAGAGERPLEDRRGAPRRARLRRHHRPPGVDRVRADPGHQRPAVAGRHARRAAARAPRPAGARQPDPAQPDAGQRSGTPRPSRCRTSSSGGSAPRASPARCGTPAARRSPPPAASWPPRN